MTPEPHSTPVPVSREEFDELLALVGKAWVKLSRISMLLEDGVDPTPPRRPEVKEDQGAEVFHLDAWRRKR